MSRMNYNKLKRRNNTPIFLRKEKAKRKWQKVEEKHGKTYEDGCFFINKKQIEKYRPNKWLPINGFYFNAVTAKFEYWEFGEMVDSIPWKVGQPALIEWENKFI